MLTGYQLGKWKKLSGLVGKIEGSTLLLDRHNKRRNFYQK